DGFNPDATTVADYMNGTPRWRTDLYANSGTLMTHDESIALIKSLGAKFTPELKAPEVPMPFDGDYTQEKYATQMLAAYKAAGLDLIGWSLERDGPLHNGGAFYHKSIKPAIDRDGDTLTVLDVLAKQVGVRGMFSDWPATTTFYASCMGMKRANLPAVLHYPWLNITATHRKRRTGGDHGQRSRAVYWRFRCR